MSDVQPVIECHNISKTFVQGDQTLTVLDDINLTIQPGDQVAIMGVSGAGKSTLMHILGGLDKPSSGEVSLEGQKIFELSEKQRGLVRNRKLGFVYQFHHLLNEFSALENVQIPLMIRGDGVAASKKQATELLKRVGLGHRLDHKPGELSGGERQRAAVARALVTEPACLLADEPTGNLDSETAAQVYDLMRELNQSLGTSLVLVTHDLSLAQRMDRVYQLEQGNLVLSG